MKKGQNQGDSGSEKNRSIAALLLFITSLFRNTTIDSLFRMDRYLV